MTIGIVDALEMVNITQADADLGLCVFKKRVQILHGAAAVVQAGQRIGRAVRQRLENG